MEWRRFSLFPITHTHIIVRYVITIIITNARYKHFIFGYQNSRLDFNYQFQLQFALTINEIINKWKYKFDQFFAPYAIYIYVYPCCCLLIDDFTRLIFHFVCTGRFLFLSLFLLLLLFVFAIWYTTKLTTQQQTKPKEDGKQLIKTTKF